MKNLEKPFSVCFISHIFPPSFCYLSDLQFLLATMFPVFSFFSPGETESLLRREREERPHTSIYFLKTSEGWNRDTVDMIRYDFWKWGKICYSTSFPKMLYNYDNINLSSAALLAQGTKAMTAKLKIISEPIEIYQCKLIL